MNDPHFSENMPVSGNPDEVRSALFAHMVMQQSSMAMMLLGKAPHPETGQIVRDLEAAKFFIDLLEMLEFKTKGNLSQEDSPPPPVESRPEHGTPPTGAASAAAPSTPSAAPDTASGEDEHRKKFTKKY